MRRVFAVLALGLILCLGTSAASALGFGRTGNGSWLGQPLDFSAVLLLDPGESISPDCVGAEVLAGDSRVAPSRVQVRLDGPLQGSRVTLRVRTTQRIVEPVVTVRVSAGCTTRVSRSFVAFLEPARGSRERPADTALTSTRVAETPVVDPTAAASAAAAQLRERERVLALEGSLNRAQADIAASQQNIAALQARLREAEAARRTPPLVYGLVTLVVLLLVVIGALLWRLAGAMSNRRLADLKSTAPSQLDASLQESALDHTWTQMRVMSGPQSLPFPAEAQAHPITVAPPPRARPEARQLTVDELIDLEQQADFFIALEQDEAAIDLLMGLLRSSGGASPMPYLKLLTIYRRRGESDAHERIRERFNRRFNAHAPTLTADSAAGQPLDAYPDVLSRIQSAWRTPALATALLEALMFRVDDAEPGFDLPAFSELLLLYSVLRDLREREVPVEGVDLLLPLGDEHSVISAGPGPSPRPNPTSDEIDLHLP